MRYSYCSNFLICLQDVKLGTPELLRNMHFPNGSLVFPPGSLVYISTDDPDGVCKGCYALKQPCETFPSGSKPEGCPEDVRAWALFLCFKLFFSLIAFLECLYPSWMETTILAGVCPKGYVLHHDGNLVTQYSRCHGRSQSKYIWHGGKYCVFQGKSIRRNLPIHVYRIYTQA